MPADAPLLVALGGLPGTGKTTIARALAAALGAVLVRIDTIEQAIRRATGLSGDGLGPAGYTAGAAVAADNLALGRDVVADAVNPLAITRAGWRASAERAGAAILEVEVVCSDPAEHRRRVETRAPDIEGHVLPDWQAVRDRRYEPWPEADLVLDTARLGPAEAVARIASHLGRDPAA